MPRVKRAADPGTVRFAREQRREPTHAEQALWALLRGGRLGPRFRRQHPLGVFVLDFYCDEARLAVEVDGPTHAEQVEYDHWRDERLLERGTKTLRLPADLIEQDIGTAVRRIREELGQ